MIKRPRFSKQINATSTFTWVLLLIPFAGWGGGENVPTILQVQSGFEANVSQFQSGSVTYRVEDYRPMENLLASLGSSPKGGIIPIIMGQTDVTLLGRGKFQWDGSRFRHEERRGHLSAEADQAVAGIVDRLETYDGGVAKNLIGSYSVDTNPMNTAVIGSVDGDLQGTRGTIGCPKPRSGGCPLFRSLAYFSPGLLETETYILDSFDAESLTMEGNRVVLSRKGLDLKVTLDPEKSYMPVEVRLGEEGVDGFYQTISYTNLNGVWFPETELTQRWSEGKLVYTTLCSLDTHEFNEDYPNEDFDITYPAGTEVEDTLQNIEYVVDAN